MPRPPAVPTDNYVDATALARAGAVIERSVPAKALGRLVQVGRAGDSVITARFQFGELDGRASLEGDIGGAVVLTCQRCMEAVSIPLQEHFNVILVQDEADSLSDVGDYEPEVVDPSRVDLQWLMEEQVLLALPLVTMHEPGQCGREIAASSETKADAETRQKPFGNLRDMLRER